MRPPFRRFPLAWGVAVSALAITAQAQPALTGQQEDTLIEALNKPEMKVRLQAALILGNAGDARCVPALIVCTRDEDFRVRGACALALGRLNDLRGVEALARLLDDREQFVREEAVRSLKLMARTEAVAYLRAAREQLSPRGRELLAEIAQSMTDTAAADALMEDLLGDEAPNVRAAVDSVLASMDAKRVRHILVAGLDHANYHPRARAAQLLGDRGIAEVQRLGAILANPAELPEVHDAARAALRRLGAAIDAAALATTVRDSTKSDSQRAEALMMLAAKGGEASYQACLAALDDSNEFIRGTAATALADLGDPRAVDSLRKVAGNPQNARIARIVQGSIRQLESVGPRVPNR